MTARYLLTVTDEAAARLEKWLGGQIRIVPAGPDDPLADLRVGDDYTGRYVPDYNRAEAERRLARIAPVVIAGLDAITDAEYEVIAARLRTPPCSPLYHAGGPG